MCPTRFKVSKSKERVSIGENELQEFNWGENVQRVGTMESGQ